MAVVTIELEMEIDKDLGVITLPEVIDYLENLIENNCLDFTVRTGDYDDRLGNNTSSMDNLH